MAPNSRAKGRRGERQVIALVQPWWAKVEPAAEFAVTPQSGGFSTRKVRAEFNLAGDLMTTSQRFPFTVEVKWRERWAMMNVLNSRPSPVWSWWLQVQESVKIQGGEPMLWFKKNRFPWHVMLSFDYAKRLRVPPPERVWTPNDLREIQVGTLPVLYLADELLKVDPMTMLQERTDGSEEEA